MKITEKLYDYWETPESIRSQLKAIYKKHNIKYNGDVWKWFSNNAIEKYESSEFTQEIETAIDSSLICHFCGHTGCSCLWKRELTTSDRFVYVNTPNNDLLEIELPDALVCGSECIQLDLSLRRIIKCIKSYVGDIQIKLVNNKIDIDALQKSLPDNTRLYLPEEYVYFNDNNNNIVKYASWGTFSWNTNLMLTEDYPKLKSVCKKRKIWLCGKNYKGTWKDNYSYIIFGGN